MSKKGDATTVRLTRDQQISTGRKIKKEGSSAIIVATYLTTFAAGIFGGLLIKEVKK